MSSSIPIVPNSDRISTASLSASTGPVTVGFPVFGGAADLSVFVGGVLIDPADWTLTSISGKNPATDILPAGDGRVTFDVAQTGDVEIIGEIKPARASQFEPGVGIPAESQNLALSKLWAALRENYSWGKSAIKLSPGERSSALPASGTRAGKILSFDANGNPEALVSKVALGNNAAIGVADTSVVGGEAGAALYNNAGKLGEMPLRVGPTEAVAGVSCAADWIWGTPTDRSNLLLEAALWSSAKVFTGLAFAKSFTAAQNSSVPDAGPNAALFITADNDGNNNDVVSILGISNVKTSGGVGFGANFIARSNGGGITAKLVGCEIDMLWASDDSVDPNSIGFVLNSFGKETPIGILFGGGVFGGSWANGIVLDDITGAGISAQANGTLGSLINTGFNVTYNNDRAIIVSNDHRIAFLTDAGNPAELFTAVNSLGLVLPTGGLVISSNDGASSLFVFSGDGAATFGINGFSQGRLSLGGFTSGYVTLGVQAAAGAYNFNLPTTAGSAGQVLTSQGGAAAAMSWTELEDIALTGDAADLTGILPGAVLVGAYTGISAVGTLTADLSVQKASPVFTARNTSVAQYTGASFRLYNNASSLGNQGGVLFSSAILDGGASQGYFALLQINYQGNFVRDLMQHNMNTNTWTFHANGNPKFQIDNTATAGHTALSIFDVDNNAVERVTVGANDSGGSGYKVLRIPN